MNFKFTLPLSILSVFSFIFIGTACNSSKNAGQMIVVRPTEIDSLLQNPGRGFATTGRVFNEDIVNKRYPPAGLVQIRRYWDVMEPEEGEIRFGMIDSILAEAHRNNQQMVFRLMAQNVKMRIPQWLREKGVTGPDYYDNPMFLKEMKEFIQEFARRYDGNPYLAFVDIGSVGQWGEWHTTVSGQGIPMPSRENQKKYIDMYTENFKKTPLVMLIGGARNGMLHYAISQGAGWRADCWGNYSKKHPGYGGKKVYSKLLSKDHAYNAWKHAPVALEPCWDMAHWYERDWPIDSILTHALQWHATVVHNADRNIPKEWWPKIKEFEKKVGYRFVLKKIKYPASVQAGEQLEYTMKWENEGVAPVYHPYTLAFRFESLKDPSESFVMDTNADIQKWMPGTTNIQSSVTITKDVGPGKYELEVGILLPKTHKPYIKLAIKGKSSQGWYKLGHIKLMN